MKIKTTLSTLIALLLVAAIGFCFFEIAKGNATAKETLLFSLLLTVASVIGSGMLTKYYADYSATDNLRVFALKAAEKVTNLSNELSRLARYLQDEVDASSNDYSSLNEALLAKELKLEFAIQMVNTLKSVNDKSLSDWQGIIGDEITAQEQEREDNEEHLREMIERLETLQSEITQTADHEAPGVPEDSLGNELQALKREVRGLATQISGVPFKRTVRARPKRQTVQKSCPSCSAVLTYRQRPKGLKGIHCSSCDHDLVSRFQNGEFTLEVKHNIPEKVICPLCKSELTIDLSPVPGESHISQCPVCQQRIKAMRATNEVRVRGLANLVPGAKVPVVTEEFIQQVKALMPPQPWPRGASKAVAAKLGVSNQAVAQAVSRLVDRGEFKLQMEGRLYAPVSECNGDDSGSSSKRPTNLP